MKKLLLSTLTGIMMSTSAFALSTGEISRIETILSPTSDTEMYVEPDDVGFVRILTLRTLINEATGSVFESSDIADVITNLEAVSTDDEAIYARGRASAPVESEARGIMYEGAALGAIPFTIEELEGSIEYSTLLDTPLPDHLTPRIDFNIAEHLRHLEGVTLTYRLAIENGLHTILNDGILTPLPWNGRVSCDSTSGCSLNSGDNVISAEERADRERQRAERDAEVKALSSRVNTVVSADNSRVIGDKDATSLDQAIVNTLNDDTTTSDIQAAARDGSTLAYAAVADRLATGETLSDNDKAQEYADRNPRFAAFQAAVANLNRQ